MSVTKRMTELLGEEGAAALSNAEAVLDNPGDLAQKAANILVVGLQADLPDEIDQAMDTLMDLMKQLRGQKKIALQRALRKMATKSRAMGVLRTVRNEIG